MSWECEKANIWANVLLREQVVKVEPTTWPRVCLECTGEDSSGCWKCDGTGEDTPEPAIKIIFSNGAELLVRSEYAAALFVKKE